MKIALKVIIFTAMSVLMITSCSRKNDSFTSRSFHGVTAKYNILFNGYNALEKGQKTVNDEYQDNYWAILPVERMQVTDEIVLEGESKNINFERAEEKAVKAIQKHGMNIKGKERNSQIDEAYLLLGKARYFDQRFVPALEAFNYILYKYPASSNINQAKVWREKTNMRLENDELAIKNLKRFIEEEEIEDQDLADITATLAQAYINTTFLDSALTQIKIAADATKKRFEQGRYNFIKGQLYNALNNKDSANIAFDKVIDLNRKIPRRYLINAHIEKAKNFDFENGDKLAFIEHLTKLEENRENNLFLDKIHHQKGQYYLQIGMDSLATAFFNKSLSNSSFDKILEAKNYEILGDMNFDKNNYKIAGAYFDSTMTKMVENSKPYRVLKRKRDNLDDVINYENIAETNDSILNLVAMSKADRTTYFENHVSKLKAIAEAEKERQAIALQKQGLVNNNAGNNNANFIKPVGSAAGASSFYFYNDQTVAYGKNEFTSIWGERQLKDNWRWSSNKKVKIIDLANNNGGEEGSENELLDVNYYLNKVIADEKRSPLLIKDRNYAYYQLGLIYKEKFKEYQLSKVKFQALLNNKPEARLLLPSKYNLFKIYEILGKDIDAQKLKNEIISNYPDSRYASILINPELALEKDKSSPESIYEATYKLFEAQKYTIVIADSKKSILTFDGHALVPKFELLKAYAIGRLYGFKDYEKAINAVAVNYANTIEGIQAQNILNSSIQTIKNPEFKDDKEAVYCKVVFSFPSNSQVPINDYKEIVDQAIDKMKYYNMFTSIDIYNPETTFVVVHGLTSIQSAKGFVDLFEIEEKTKMAKPFFGISSENYRTLQIHKNLEAYNTNK